MARAVLADDPHDPQALYIMARTEPGGLGAQSWAEKAFQSAGDQPPGDEAALLLIEVLAAGESYDAIIEQGAEFSRTFADDSPCAETIRWWVALAKLKLGQTAEAESDIRISGGHSRSGWGGRLQLLYADSRTNPEEAVPAYRELSGTKDRYLESQSLLGLVWAYEELGEHDRTVLYRGILAEKYPNTQLLLGDPEIPSTKITPSSDDDRAERLADIVYTVQLGAFADKDNARKLRDKYQKRGYTVNFFSREIADKTYWVVQVGAFTRLEKAQEFQEKLQIEDRTTYRVVVR